MESNIYKKSKQYTLLLKAKYRGKKKKRKINKYCGLLRRFKRKFFVFYFWLFVCFCFLFFFVVVVVVFFL